MIVLLLTCSISWCQNNYDDYNDNNDDYSFYEYKEDSVLVPISALKVANAKMIELKYEKVINENLRQTIKLDSEFINALEDNLYDCALEFEEHIYVSEAEIDRIKKQRNAAIITGSGTSAVLLTILLLILL